MIERAWGGGIGHCATNNTNSSFLNMDMDTEKICMANFLVTTVLLQNIDLATSHILKEEVSPTKESDLNNWTSFQKKRKGKNLKKAKTKPRAIEA
jgi:hypothetical protein